MTFDRATIAAYIDGELDLVTAKRIEKAMETDAELTKVIEDEMDLRSKLHRHFAPLLVEAVPDRLTALLTPSVANIVDNSLDQRRARRAATWYRPSAMQFGAMAASLVVGLMIGGTALNRNAGIVSDRGGQIMASGALATALDTQLASNQPAGAEIRIGTSFAAKEGGFCRTFESASLDGIACNADGQWQLRQTLSGKQTSQYRQASAGTLAEAASAMMAGDPLDAAEEKAAQSRKWK